MVAAGVFERIEVPGIGECVMTRQLSERVEHVPPDAVAKVRARLIDEGILLDSVKEWLRRRCSARYGVNGFMRARITGAIW
jgi:hypothetical protein